MPKRAARRRLLSSVANAGAAARVATGARCVREGADVDGIDAYVPEGSVRESKSVTGPARVPADVTTALVAMPSDGTDVDVCTAGLATGRGTTDVSNICNAGLAACRSSTGLANI